LNEDYTDEKSGGEFEGGYVMQPLKEKANNVLYLDFASLYPMLFIHANLFSYNCECCSQKEKWHGNELFQVKGFYCAKKQGKKEELIKTLFLKRKEYRQIKDNREFALKIVLNSTFGVSSRPSFKHLYSKYTASDCTFLARQCIQYTIKKLNENGYNVVYADTDSCFIELGNSLKEDCIKLTNNISKKISNSFPFPWEEFNFKLEEEIKYIQFFKDENNELKKKTYLYINKNNKIVPKGLDIIKKDCSELSIYIYENFLKNQIIEKCDCLFDKDYINNLIKNTLEKNKLLLAKSFNIKDSEYKSDTSLYSLIRDLYGSGEIKLIKNYKIGAGKAIKYCSIEEAEKLNISDLNLEDVYKELSPFIKNYKKESYKKEQSLEKLF
jgi:DNA polymerase elongation subunit (family B)